MRDSWVTSAGGTRLADTSSQTFWATDSAPQILAGRRYTLLTRSASQVLTNPLPNVFGFPTTTPNQFVTKSFRGSDSTDQRQPRWHHSSTSLTCIALLTINRRPPGPVCLPGVTQGHHIHRPSRLRAWAAAGRIRGKWLLRGIKVAPWQDTHLRDMREAGQGSDPVTAPPELLALLTRSTWVQVPESDAPNAQPGDSGAPAAAKQAAAQLLPCLDASHPSNCSMCEPAARNRERNGSTQKAVSETCW